MSIHMFIHMSPQICIHGRYAGLCPCPCICLCHRSRRAIEVDASIFRFNYLSRQVCHHYIGHNYAAENYIGHNYAGENYVGHNYIDVLDPFIFRDRCAYMHMDMCTRNLYRRSMDV